MSICLCGKQQVILLVVNNIFKEDKNELSPIYFLLKRHFQVHGISEPDGREILGAEQNDQLDFAALAADLSRAESLSVTREQNVRCFS